MEAEEYYEFLSKAMPMDNEIAIPVEPWPGEEPYDAILRWLLEEGIFVESEGSFYVDLELAEKFDPALAEWALILIQAETYSHLDKLEELGLIYSSVNEEGEMIWGLTPAGEEAESNLFE